MHPYQEACKTRIPFGRTEEGMAPGRVLLELLSEVSDWLGIFPCIQDAQGGKTAYILYRNVVLPLTDFWDYFGRGMACISQVWPLCAYGTAENQETVRLQAVSKESGIELVQQTLSGKSTEVMRTLCFQIDCTDRDTADKLIHFLWMMDWQTVIKAVSWRDADFLKEQGLTIDTKNRTQFCYVGLDSQATKKSLLDSLDFGQKTILWMSFLKDGFEPVEFEWLAEEISENTLDNRMEWVLALQEAMDHLNFRMINRNKDFEVYDGAGQRRYFGADCRCPAEWVFTKILFPLNN